jgi:hypothetical protein
VTKRHAENNTGKKGKSATSGAERRIQRGRLAKKRCKRFSRMGWYGLDRSGSG